MQSTSGKVIVTAVVDKKLPASVSISIGFPVTGGNWFVYKKLNRSVPCGCPSLANGSEITSAAFAIYDNVREKLIGTPAAQIKSGVSSVKCNYRNDEFSIHLICPANGTAVKRAVTTTVKAITPHKLYAKYAANIVILNGKPTRAEFITVSNELVKNMMLNIFIVGKLSNVTIEKIDDLAKISNDKLNLVELEPSGERPKSESMERTTTNFPTVTAKSYHALIVVDFISTATNLNTAIADTEVIIYNEHKIPKISDKAIEKYSSWYEKQGVTVKPMLLYTASATYNLDTFSLLDLMSSDISVLQIKKILTDIYKYV
jgi:hypothetical protein